MMDNVPDMDLFFSFLTEIEGKAFIGIEKLEHEFQKCVACSHSNKVINALHKYMSNYLNLVTRLAHPLIRFR